MKPKYTTIFSSVIKPLVPEEKDKYLALASLVDVGNFIPNIDTSKNFDLLPIAFNACVVNRVNKNGDVIDTATAAEIYKNFINKPINLEHNRERVVGVILSAGFSEFGTDAPLTEENIKDLKGPFNITLGGIVWKVVNNKLTQLIEESNDPTSEDYQKISASWELGFSEYVLAVVNGDSKNLEDAEIINDYDKVTELSDYLRSLGGTGKLKDGRSVYRKVVADVVPLGIGLTENPAADVKGVASKQPEMMAESEEKCEKECQKEGGVCDKKCEIEHKDCEEESKSSEILEILSHSEENNVNKTTKIITMKISKIEEINDESMKQLSASAVTEFIADEMKKASEQFSAERDQKENALKAALETQDQLKAELEKIQKTLAELEAAKAAKETEELFNARMASFDSEYNLDDEDRAIIASDIKEMNEEIFSAYNKKMSVLMKGKKKTAKATEEKVELVAEVKASETIVEEILEKAEVKPEPVIATTAASETSLFEKYKKAFSLEQFEIKH